MEFCFIYDHILREVLNECTLNPSEVPREESDWLYAQNQKYPDVDYEKTGKWMIFIQKEEIDSVWNQIKEAIKDGNLWNSKVSTSDPSDPVHAIMIYTKDYADIDDVISALEYLESSGIKPANKVIHYKTDQQTRAGVYSGGKQRASIYSSNTIRTKRRPHGDGEGGLLSWRRRDGSNNSNAYFSKR